MTRRSCHASASAFFGFLHMLNCLRCCFCFVDFIELSTGGWGWSPSLRIPVRLYNWIDELLLSFDAGEQYCVLAGVAFFVVASLAHLPSHCDNERGSREVDSMTSADAATRARVLPVLLLVDVVQHASFYYATKGEEQKKLPKTCCCFLWRNKKLDATLS